LGQRIGRTALIIAGLGFAIAFAPIALGLSLAWFAGRGLVYATAKRATADIVDWQGRGDVADLQAGEVATALAFPVLVFEDHDGATRRFVSRIGFRIHDEPPPAGRQRIRYHVRPWFFAELDWPSEWFTGPVLALVLALAGTFLGWLARLLALPWF
jgi:hypothetical protein